MLRKPFFLFLCSFPVIYVIAQNPIIDSIENVLKTTKNDTTRLVALNDLCFRYRPINPQKSLTLGKDAIALAQKLGKSKIEASVNNNIGNACSAQGNYDSALVYFKKSIVLYKKIGDKKGQAAPTYNLGDLYMHKGDLNIALGYELESLKLNEAAENQNGVASSCNGIGLLYLELNKTKEARAYFERGLDIYTQKDLKYNMTAMLCNIGLSYEKENPNTKTNNTKALEYYLRAMKLLEGIGDQYSLAVIYENVGGIYVEMKLFEKGLPYLEKSLKLKEEINDLEGITRSYKNLAGTYDAMGNSEKAVTYFTKALQLAKQIGGKIYIKDIDQALAIHYEKAGDYKKAYFFFKEHAAFKDTILNEEGSKHMTEMQTKYQTEKKEKEIELLNKDKQIQSALTAEETKRKNTILGSIAAVLALVLVFSFFMYNRFRITRRQKNIIEKQKVIVEQERAEADHQRELVEEKQKEILDSINYAKRIQNALLASNEMLSSNLKNHFVLFKPKDIVSGDFYWATEHQNKFYLAVCDSTGHGVPGAFMSLLNIGFLSEGIKEKDISETNEILNYVRKRLVSTISKEGQQDGFDGILLCIDKTSNTYTYSAAYNSPTLLSQGQLSNLGCDKMPVGKGEKTDSFAKHTITFIQGDTLYLYTDGFADQFGGPKGKKFKYKQLEDMLLSINHLPLDEQSSVLNQKFEDWRGDLEQVDDVLIIGIRL
jgi:serine phosphatase RsbU (regulator of sigma subunit)/Tfp pilus assembly protein PilF